MKAIRVNQFGGPEVLKVEDLPVPQPAEGQVLIKVHAVGVNPVDTYMRSGRYTRLPALPYTPGTDAAGTVEAVGSGVKSFVPGDRVYTSVTITGAYAEYTLSNGAHVYRLPERVSFSEGAGVNVPYATAYRALFQRAHAQPGEIVLIHGASGGVGIAAVQIARAAGLTIIGTGGTERGRELVGEQGAHHVLDHTAAGYLDAVLGLTDGRGVDLILEMLANVNLGKDLNLLAYGGRVVVIGNRGTVEIDPRATMGRDAAILGMSLLVAPEAALKSVHAALVAGLEAGTLRPIVGQELPLAEAARAHEAVMAAGAYGKIVLIP